MKEKTGLGLGGSVIPEPLTPYPYIATAFFTVLFVNTPLNPYLATGFKTRKCRFCRGDLGQKEHERTNRTNNQQCLS